MFYGQNRIWKQVDYIIPKLQQGTNLNVLFQAPSGYGKTKIAIETAIRSYLQEDVQYELPDSEGSVWIDQTKRCIILDEVHEIKMPELLYPLLDSGNWTFLLCTNESGELKEPLRNRCIHLIFDDYTVEEITEIVSSCFDSTLPYSLCAEIARNCQNNPRIAKIISKQLGFVFEQETPTTVEDVRNVLQNVLQIHDGINPEQQRYLDFLRKVNRASLDLIASVIRVDKKSITQQIEPYLIRAGMIHITSRGRHYGGNF